MAAAAAAALVLPWRVACLGTLQRACVFFLFLLITRRDGAPPRTAGCRDAAPTAPLLPLGRLWERRA